MKHTRPLIILLALLIGIGIWLETAVSTRAATFTVTTSADSGPGSLRQAILDANASPGLDNITFDIGQAGSQQTIAPQTSLPPIIDPVQVDGWSQGGAGYSGPPLVKIDGSAIGGTVRGLDIRGGDSVIRGLVVANFTCDGIRLLDGDNNWVYANYVGVDFDGATAQPNGSVGNCYGVMVASSATPSENNIIGTDGDGVNDTLEGNLISGNVSAGLNLQTAGNQVAGNLIGTDVAGTTALPNGQGVTFSGDNTVIGTNFDGVSDDLEGNLISGNSGLGVGINNSSGHVIAGNIIGLDAAGGATLGNDDQGIICNASAVNSRDILIENNVISGNGSFGFTTIYGDCRHITLNNNKIGTNISGTAALGNGGAGISISSGDWYTITNNLISGNGTGFTVEGITTGSGANNITIVDNIIGSDVSGTLDLGNSGRGITIQFSGDYAIRGNQIAGNGGEGIYAVSSDALLFENNLIGVQADGSSSLGNSSHGIYIVNDSVGNTVVGNTIAHNSGDGILINGSQAIGNTISGNGIFDNSQLGIDLGGNGVTLNDPEDGDSGPNNLQNYPELTGVSNLPLTVTISGTLASTASTSFTLEFFYSNVCDPDGNGEGRYYLGSESATTNGSGFAAFSVSLPELVPQGNYITATATDPAGSTSEFSACLGPTGPVPDIPIQGLASGNDGPVQWGQPVTLFAAVTSGTNVAYSWQPGDGSGPLAGDVLTYTYAVAGTYTATVEASNNGSFATATTVVTVLPAGTIHGQVWMDEDGDAFFGLGEDGVGGITITVDGVGDFTTGADGTWQAPSLPLGNYEVTLTPPAGLTTTLPTRTVILAQSGFFRADFPVGEIVPAGIADLRGRVWSDANGNGYPDRDESPFANHPVTLTEPLSATVFTNDEGLFIFDALAFSIAPHRVESVAPDDHTPAAQSVTVAPIEGSVNNAPLGFVPLGSISGRVTGPANTAANRTVTLIGDGAVTTQTDSQGFYRFDNVVANVYELTLEAPPGYFVAGPDTRAFVFRGGSQVENWQIVTAGSLSFSTHLLDGAGSQPLGAVPIQVSNDEGYDALHFTRPTGWLYLNNLEPAVYTARVRTDLMGVNLVASPPVRNNLVVQSGRGIVTEFTLSTPRSLLAVCRSFTVDPITYPGNGFECGVRIQSAVDGTMVVETTLPATVPERLFGLPASGTYSVTLIMADLRYDGWPDYETRVVVNDASPTIEARYPYALGPSQRTIAGYAFLDENGNGVREYEPFLINEHNADVANGLTVELYDLSDNLLDTTTTSRRTSSHTGYFEFTDLAFGEYRVRYTLPAPAGGLIFVPTTALEKTVSLTPEGNSFSRNMDFGFEPSCADCISGRVFFDDGDGLFDPENDTPYADQTVVLTDAAGATTTVQTDDGGYFRFENLTTLASYQVELVWDAPTDPPTQLVRSATPGIAGLARVDYALDSTRLVPRAVAFFDLNLSGSYNGYGEPSVPGVTLELYDAPCGRDGALVESVVAEDGFAEFSTPLAEAGCILPVLASLPPGVQPFHPRGSHVAPLNRRIVGVPLVDDARTLLVQPFWDRNGNGVRDSNEPIETGLFVDVAPTLAPERATHENGALYNLPAGVYAVEMVTIPPGMESAIPLPATVILNEESSVRHEIPLRFRGRINGVVFADNPFGATQFNGVPVELRDLNDGLVTTTVTAGSRSGQGHFSFGNVSCGTYRLTIPSTALPAGYRLAGAPVVPFDDCATIQQNVELVPLGDVVGRIYWDGNFNSTYDPGESTPNVYDVALVDEVGNVTTTTPAPDGTFRFEDLTPGVRYNLTVPQLQEYYGFDDFLWHSITESPGWFTADMTNVSYNVGIGPFVPFATDDNTEAWGTVYVQTGMTRQPIPGAVIGYTVDTGPYNCNADGGPPLGQTTTDLNGRFQLDATYQPNPDLYYCLYLIDAPGYEQVNWVPFRAANCDRPENPAPQCNPTLAIDRDIEVVPTGGNQALSTAGGNPVRWSAFQDLNVNGVWDTGEQPLPGVILSTGAISSTSAIDGSGVLVGLNSGETMLSVVPPAGYAALSPDPTVWLNGAALDLPPLAFRPAGLLLGTLFADADGDGRQMAHEAGVGDVTVTVTGPATASTATDLNGGFSFADLPDGTYTLSVMAPAGFGPVDDRILTLLNGGAVSVPLVALNQVSGVIYEDWDGDGARGVDELRVATPLTATLGTADPLIVHQGRVLFWDVPGGTYDLTVYWGAVNAITIGASAAVGLPAVAPGIVRGTLWLDANDDGIRQPWEAPLSGIPVTLDGGESVVTDGNGRYVFFSVATGPHTLEVTLPDGLAGEIPPVTVSAGRGAAVGIAVVPVGPTNHTVYLPFIKR